MSRAASDEKVPAADPNIAEHCFEGEQEDEILFEPLKVASTVMFRIQGQSNNHCYDLYNWGQAIVAEAEKKASAWNPEETTGGTYAYTWPAANRRAWLPVLKLPRAFIYVQTTPHLLLRFNTFIIVKLGKTSYSTPFGVSALHAVKEDIYTAFPINRYFLIKKDFKVDVEGPGYVFSPTLDDVRNGQLKDNTIVMVQANGSFSEVNSVTGKTYAYYNADSELPIEPERPEEEEKEREEKKSEEKEAEDPNDVQILKRLNSLNKWARDLVRTRVKPPEWGEDWKLLFACAREWIKGKMSIYPPPRGERVRVLATQIMDVRIGISDSLLNNPWDPRAIMSSVNRRQITIVTYSDVWPAGVSVPSLSILFHSGHALARMTPEGDRLLLTITPDDLQH